MYSAAGAAHHLLYLPLRRLLVRLLGHRPVQVLDEVADASSEVSSTTRSTAPLLPQTPLQSRLMDRLRARPQVFDQVRRLAACAAQVELVFVNFTLNFEFSSFSFLLFSVLTQRKPFARIGLTVRA